MTRPAKSGCMRTLARYEKIFSEADFVTNTVGAYALPTRPIVTAERREIRTHTVATRRLFVSSSDFLIAMNLRRT